MYLDDPLSVLENLRWKADMKVISPDEPGVLIWLKQMPPIEMVCGYDEYGKEIIERHGYIIHCCYADDPCDYHKQIENNINKSLKN